MADYKLSFTAEEIDALLTKMNSGVCLPVVELSTIVQMDGTTTVFSSEESAKLSKACESGLPVCVKMLVGAGDVGVPMSAIATFASEIAGSFSLIVLLSGTQILFASGDTGWTATFGA